MIMTSNFYDSNADASTDAVAVRVRYFRENYDMSHVHFFDNMVPDDFLRLVCNSMCLIGNSSMGTSECSLWVCP